MFIVCVAQAARLYELVWTFARTNRYSVLESYKTLTKLDHIRGAENKCKKLLRDRSSHVTHSVLNPRILEANVRLSVNMKSHPYIFTDPVMFSPYGSS